MLFLFACFSPDGRTYDDFLDERALLPTPIPLPTGTPTPEPFSSCSEPEGEFRRIDFVNGSDGTAEFHWIAENCQSFTMALVVPGQTVGLQVKNGDVWRHWDVADQLYIDDIVIDAETTDVVFSL